MTLRRTCRASTARIEVNAPDEPQGLSPYKTKAPSRILQPSRRGPSCHHHRPKPPRRHVPGTLRHCRPTNPPAFRQPHLAASGPQHAPAGSRRTEGVFFMVFMAQKELFTPNKISTINFTIIHKFAARKITKNKNKNAQNMTNRPNCMP